MRNFLTLCLLFKAFLAWSADKPNASGPILLKANKVKVYKKQNKIYATGQVEIYQNNLYLKADEIQYLQEADKLVAKGHVQFRDHTGNTYFSDHLEMSKDLKEGTLKALRILLADDSKFAANFAEKGANHLQLEKGVYSPCDFCRTDPSQSPLWQLKSRSILWDEEDHIISYTDAYIEFFGVPVFYTPYLSHPDPSIRRKEGFLAPKLGTDTKLGTFTGLSYYTPFSPSRDLTLTSYVTTKEGVILGMDYRHLFEKGFLRLKGSLGGGANLAKETDNTKEKSSFRGHIDSELKWDLNPFWRMNVKLQRASDKAYLNQFKFYGLHGKTPLTSKINAEGFYGSNYFSARSYWFQGMRNMDRESQTPLILPHFIFSIQKTHAPTNIFWNMDGDVLVTNRTKGNKSRRLMIKNNFEKQMIDHLGCVHTMGLNLETSLYHVEKHDNATSESRNLGFTGRTFPKMFYNLSYPLVRSVGDMDMIMTPQVQVVGAPKRSEDKRILPEDLLLIEPTDLNVFNNHRFSGQDRVDDGSRVVSGIQLFSQAKDLGYGELFLGQAYHFHAKEKSYLKGTSLNQKTSDYVGRVHLSFPSILDLRYRFRVCQKNLKPKRSEFMARMGPEHLNLQVDYSALPSSVHEEKKPGGKQVMGTLNFQPHQFWNVSFSHTRDVGKKGGKLAEGISAVYQDECFTLGLSFSREFFRDRNLKPNSTFFLRLGLKNIGEFSHNVSSNDLNPLEDFQEL